MKSLGVFPEENARYIGRATVADFNILTQSDRSHPLLSPTEPSVSLLVTLVRGKSEGKGES